MKIELTEQQARSVAAIAQQGLEIEALRDSKSKTMNPGDTSAAYAGMSILNRAWRQATNTAEPADLASSTDG